MNFKDDLAKIKFVKKQFHYWYTHESSIADIANKILNIRFVNGDQYMYWDSGSLTKQEPKENVIPVVSNMLQPYVEMMKARVLSMNARPVISAATNDHDKKVLARGYSKAYRGILKKIRFNRKLQKIVDIEMKCGGAWLYPFWNKEMKDGKFKGNFDIEVLHDITAVVDPFCDDDNNCRYVMFFDMKSDKWVQNKYQPKKPMTKLNILHISNSVLNTVFQTLKRYPYSKSRLPEIEDGVLLFTVFYYDDAGRVHCMRCLDDEVLEDNIVKHFPTYIRCYTDGLSFSGTTPLSSLRLAQREINDILTRIKATLRKPAKLFINEEHVQLSADLDTYDDTANEIVRYRSDLINERPFVVAPPPLNPVDMQIWLRQFSEVGGLSESSKGNLASSQLSKVAIQFLSQQDETKLGNVKDNLQEGLEQVLYNGMDIIDDHYTDERMVQVFGSNYSWEAVQWVKMGNDRDIYDVRMDMGSNLPSAPMQRLEIMLGLLNQGLFEDLPNKLAYVRDVCDISPFDLDNVDPDIDKQWAEIQMMKNGEGAVIIQVDDDIKHIQVLQQYMKQPEFMNMDHKIQVLLSAHLNQHMAKFWEAHKSEQPQGNIPREQQQGPTSQQQAQGQAGRPQI